LTQTQPLGVIVSQPKRAGEVYPISTIR